MVTSRFQTLFFVALIVSILPVSLVYSNEKSSLTTLCLSGAVLGATTFGAWKLHQRYRQVQLLSGVINQDVSITKSALRWNADPNMRVKREIGVTEIFYTLDSEGAPLFTFARDKLTLEELTKAGITNLDISVQTSVNWTRIDRSSRYKKTYKTQTRLNNLVETVIAVHRNPRIHNQVRQWLKCEYLDRTIDNAWTGISGTPRTLNPSANYAMAKHLIESGASIDPRTSRALLLAAAYNCDFKFADRLYCSGCTNLPSEKQQQILSYSQRKIIDYLSAIAFKQALQTDPEILPGEFPDDLVSLTVDMLTNEDHSEMQKRASKISTEQKFKVFSLSEAIAHNYTWDEAIEEEMEELVIS